MEPHIYIYIIYVEPPKMASWICSTGHLLLEKGIVCIRFFSVAMLDNWNSLQHLCIMQDVVGCPPSETVMLTIIVFVFLS